MTDEQFKTLKDMLEKQHEVIYEILGQSLATLGEMNYYLGQLAKTAQAEQQAEQNEADPAKKETEAEASFYIVRQESSGELGLILYPSSKLLKQSNGKVYSEDMYKLHGVVEIDLNEPHWTQKTTPDKDQLEEMRTEYLRPLGGVLKYVRGYRPPTGKKEMATRPLDRVISFTPYPQPAAAQPTRQTQPAAAKPAAAQPATTQPEPPPKTPPPPQQQDDNPFADVPQPKAEPPEDDHSELSDTMRASALLQDARYRYRQAVEAALGPINAYVLNQAMDIIAARWATMQDPPRKPQYAQDMTNNDLDLMSAHVNANPIRWKEWYARKISAAK